MCFIQYFMRPCKFEESNGNRTILPEIINPKFPAEINCVVSACESCMLASDKNHLTNTNKFKPLEVNEGALLHDKIEFGDFSTDQFVCNTTGRLPTCYGRGSCYRHF